MNIIALIILLIYLLSINLVSFILFGVDKRRARRSLWRISEGTLIACSIFGGSIGALYGMKFFRHKTRHRKFTLGIPAILAVQVCAAGYIIFRTYFS